MAKSQEQAHQTETDRMIGEIVMYSLIGIIGIIFFLPPLLGMLIFAVIHMFKRDWISYVALGVGVLLLLWQIQSGNILTYFGFISEMNIPYLSTGIERFLNEGHVIKAIPSSYVVLVGIAFLFSFGFFIFAKFFWKKRVTTKSGKVQQQKYRNKPSKEVFVGYTDFKERVSLESKELNYHMLATGGIGTGKTTLIASLMEAALQQDKPIIFVDGKGERKSMLEFKSLCEAYGKNVYLFSDMDHLTYNPIKNGTPTETRDKLMSLFSFSLVGDGAYYTDIASRYLQLAVKLIDEAGEPREIKTIARLTNFKYMNEFFKEHSIVEEIEEEVEVEVEEEVVVRKPEQTSQDDDLSDFIAPSEPKIKIEMVKKIVVEKRQRSVTKLQEGMKRIKNILDDEFPEEIVEGCLTRLKMQLGELLESDLGHLFIESEKGIDLQKITDDNDVVILSISGSRYAHYIQKIWKMIILDVNNLVAYRQAKGCKSIFCVYDEFSAYGDRRIVDIVNKSRSA
ncbi:type IV secretion system DNA-binding domain-containing protein [Neobacillus drentensis]|uniref:type IV secretion system DNA-binding domain-containing protein n=1 Tax=Neobacillus drentensis TaxID=220684 RepID=UPI00300020F8